jgi:hypothetical protein
MWPAIWMLPENDTYGPWPVSGACAPQSGTIVVDRLFLRSGEIDIMEARGNAPSYPFQYAIVMRAPHAFRVLILAQGYQLRPRLFELGSYLLVKRGLEDIWVVEHTAVSLLGRLPHVPARVVARIPVRRFDLHAPTTLKAY